MKKTLLIMAGVAVCFACGSFTQKMMSDNDQPQQEVKDQMPDPLKMGVFSLSLNVQDVAVSKAFYEQMGFTQMGGDLESNYVIMKNDKTIIGLFNGFFEGQMLTFNPGWDENGKNIDPFDDVRKIQRTLNSFGVTIDTQCDEATTGPAFIMFKDPDGNVILVDQHR
jgi:catechol 2,3-dioxygenase-like lactoylglutathione lyase family enzyme